MNTGYEYTNIVAAAPTTTLIRTGRGVLRKVVINEPLAGGIITIYDNTAGSGTKIATITCATTTSDTPISLDYDVRFGKGLTIVTSGAAQDITVAWSNS